MLMMAHRRLLALAAGLAAAALSAGMAHAQSGMDRRLDRMEHDLKTLQSIVLQAQATGQPVVVRPEAGTRATVLEVRTADRPGVLYLVTAALARLDITVRSAHVDTLGPQAVDVFYLQEASAAELGEERAAAAATAVRSALAPE